MQVEEAIETILEENLIEELIQPSINKALQTNFDYKLSKLKDCIGERCKEFYSDCRKCLACDLSAHIKNSLIEELAQMFRTKLITKYKNKGE